MYSPQVLEHFEHPRNSGVVASPDASVQIENPACGDVLKLTARCSEGRITELRFQAKGCVPAIASGSALTELIAGKTLEAAAELKREDLVKVLGGLPPASRHASYLAIDALTALVRDLNSLYRARSGQ